MHLAGILLVMLVAGAAGAEEKAAPGWTPRVNAFMDAGGELRMSDMDEETLGDDSGFFMRAFGVFLGAQLSPSTSFFTGTCYQDGFKIGVAYITLHGLLPRLDQFDRPLPLRLFLGPEGLEQIGVSLEWALPLGLQNNSKIILQATNGANPRLFSGEFYSVPVGLLRLEQAVGLSSCLGMRLGLIWFVDESDFFTWRTEGFWVGKQAASGDLAQPFAVDNHDELLWQAVAYIGLAPWSRIRLRLQASHQEGGGMPADDRLILQVSLCTNFPAVARKRRSP